MASDCDASVEYDTKYQLGKLEPEQNVRCFCDAQLKLLPAGFEVLEDDAAAVRRVPITSPLAEEQDKEDYMTLNWDWAATSSQSSAEQSKLPWAVIRAALEANWLTSSFLRTQRPPTLAHSRRHGLSGTVVLTRDVTTQECQWLENDLIAGERFHVYTGNTFGCISPEGLAVQRLGEEDESSPFMELPAVCCANHDRECVIVCLCLYRWKGSRVRWFVLACAAGSSPHGGRTGRPG